MSTKAITNEFGVHPAQIGMWMFLGTVTMLFAAFTSAYIVRRSSADWVHVTLPTVLWANTGLLLASSMTLEAARGAASRGRVQATVLFLAATTGLGLLFVGGQFAGWRELAAQGVFVPTSPHSSFFYILTGLHALHVAGGLVFLVSVAWRVTRRRQGAQMLVRLGATYWHFMGGLWVFLFLVLARL